MRGGHGGRGMPTKRKADMSLFQLIRQTLPYIWTRNNFFLKITFLCSLVFLIAGSLGDLVVPVTLKYAVDALQPPDPSFPFWPIMLYGLASFASSACDQLRDIFFAYVSANTERLVALETFEHLQALSLQFHLKRETGSVLRSVSRGASSFAGLLRIVLFQILPVFFQVIVVCIFLFMRYKWYFGAVTGGVIALYFTFTFTTTDWRDKYRRIMNEKDNEFNQKATDALLNFETVKYFNAEAHEEARYDAALREYSQANIRSQQTLAVLNAGQQLIIVGGVVGVMILASKLVANEELKVGDFVMLYQFILTLYQPLGFLGTYYRMIKQSMVDVESMILIWQEKPDIKDVPGAPDLVLRHAAPEVRFENVSFHYANGVPILRNVSFVVRPGKKLAIVGASGAGKSTLARLLYRFYDATSGSISVDGTDITRVTQGSLRREIAIVPQDTVLFNDTIGYNIAYGAYALHEQGASEAQIHDAAHAAQLDAFIERQPKKYDTRVGERGLRLSGGEKQRVSIARAILKKPGIMVFDEATSSLDTHTEAEIQAAIHAVAAGRTTITVAHRLSTIAHSDVIIVLDHGTVAEQGTHEELLAKRGGLYAKMWHRQQKTIELQEGLSKIAKEEEEHAKEQSTPIEGGRTLATTAALPASPPAFAAHVTAAPPAVGTASAASAATPAPQSDYAAAILASRGGALGADASANLAPSVPLSLSVATNASSSRSADSVVGDSSSSPPTSPSLRPTSPTSPSLREVRRQMSAAVSRAKKNNNGDSALHQPLLPRSPDDSDSVN